MGVIIDGLYTGNKKVRLEHEPSGAVLITDAPKDNQGEGSSFSPTDLVAAALGSCMMTIVGIVAERNGIELSGMRMRVEKEMRSEPRRVASLSLAIHMPRGIPLEQREKFERAARTCPVEQSLHPEVHVEVNFLYDV